MAPQTDRQLKATLIVRWIVALNEHWRHTELFRCEMVALIIVWVVLVEYYIGEN